MKPLKGLIVVHSKRCVSCHSCEIGCSVEHSQSKALFTAIFETPRPRTRIFVEHSAGTSLPLQCRHCEDAPCISVCPTGAMSRNDVDEAVLVQQDLCIGCKWCILACPFGAVSQHDTEKTINKCDLCMDRTPYGLPPACVNSCPTGALEFTDILTLTRDKRREFLVDFLGESKEASPDGK